MLFLLVPSNPIILCFVISMRQLFSYILIPHIPVKWAISITGINGVHFKKERTVWFAYPK